LPPFIDGSCRREPDFESAFPSITATCRGGHFAPRLSVGDRIAYLTVKGRYFGATAPSWRLVAVLRAIERFESHETAAAWYTGRGLPLPSNCLVEGNPPKPFDATNGNPPADVKARILGEADHQRAVRLWDAGYRQRVARWPVLIVTEAEFLELRNPPDVTSGDLCAVFGNVPGTLNPPAVACSALDSLLQRAIR
jgi:hypothetical protein